jgi:pimeloyl-ACP methyl ester carboxylesterase
MYMQILLKVLKITLYSIAALALVVACLFGHTDKSLDDLKPKYAQAPSAFVDIEGLTVHYRDEGNQNDTLPLVLIHGTSSSLHTFDAWTAALKGEKRVVRMDLPGFGLTGAFANHDYSMAHYSAFIAQFLSQRGIKRCILAGNSLGGRIAWQFTLDQSAMVKKLILIDAAGYPTPSKSAPIGFILARKPVLNKILTFITPRSMVESSLKNVYADKTKVTEDLVTRYFDLTLREGNRQALIDRMTGINDTSQLRFISRIQQPTLVLWGAEDMLIPLSSGHRFHADLPKDTLVVLQNAGHVPMEECPKESLAAVKAFLKQGF